MRDFLLPAVCGHLICHHHCYVNTSRQPLTPPRDVTSWHHPVYLPHTSSITYSKLRVTAIILECKIMVKLLWVYPAMLCLELITLWCCVKVGDLVMTCYVILSCLVDVATVVDHQIVACTYVDNLKDVGRFLYESRRDSSNINISKTHCLHPQPLTFSTVYNITSVQSCQIISSN